MGKGRREPAVKMLRTGLRPVPERRRGRAAPHNLCFQSRGQLISIGKPGRKVALMFVIPSAHSVAVVILVVALVLVVTISMFFVTLSVSVSMPLGQREIACERQNANCNANHPSCRAHCSLRF